MRPINSILSSPAASATLRRLSGTAVSARIFTIPFPARRNAKGSFDPVGSIPRANMPAIVSALSAMASTAPSVVSGTTSSIPAGRYWS